MQEQIGLAAGSIYEFLKKKGENSTATLKKELSLDATIIPLGIGWLAREGKVNVRTKGKSVLVSLNNGA